MWIVIFPQTPVQTRSPKNANWIPSSQIQCVKKPHSMPHPFLPFLRVNNKYHKWKKNSSKENSSRKQDARPSANWDYQRVLCPRIVFPNLRPESRNAFRCVELWYFRNCGERRRAKPSRKQDTRPPVGYQKVTYASQKSTQCRNQCRRFENREVLDERWWWGGSRVKEI